MKLYAAYIELHILKLYAADIGPAHIKPTKEGTKQIKQQMLTPPILVRLSSDRHSN